MVCQVLDCFTFVGRTKHIERFCDMVVLIGLGPMRYECDPGRQRDLYIMSIISSSLSSTV